MKHFKTFFLLAIIISIFSFCKKDALTSKIDETAPYHTSTKFNWSASEQAFFSLDPRILNSVQSRSAMGGIYHPLLLEAHNKIAMENEAHSFVDGIVRNAGLPIWSKSFVYCNPQSRDKFVLIPLAPENQNQVSGFISLYKKDDGTDTDFVINAMSRQDLLDTTSGNPWQKAEYTKYMLKYDHLLFNSFDLQLKYAYCKYRSSLPTLQPTQANLNLFFPPPPPCVQSPSPNPSCEWRILEVCTDTVNQTTWFGGTEGPLPSPYGTWFDGDHDDDGIPDENDQDYQYWEDEFRDWWDDHYDDQDFDDVFDGDHDNDGVADEFDPDWDDFFDDLERLLEDIGGWFDDVWSDIDDWWDDLWDGDIDCPWDDPLRGSAGDREIICEWFYVLDCGTGASGTNWYDTFADVVPCPECPGYQEYHYILRDRMYDHFLEHYTGDIDDFWGLYNIASGCNAYSPCFEECVDESFANAYFNAPPETEILTFPEDFDNCFKSSTDCPACTYTVVLYIEQPIPGTREIFDWNGSGTSGSGKNSGHTFLSLNQYDPSVSLIEPIRTKTFGFYPVNKPHGMEEVIGFFYEEDANSRANISVTYQLTLAQFEDIKSSLSMVGNMYQVGYSNCSTIPAHVLIHAGFNIPMTHRWQWPFGDIDVNPADLGEDLRANHAPGYFSSSNTYFTPPLSKCD